MGSDELRTLADGAAEIVPDGALAEKLALGRPLRIKFGVDPTAEHVTLGWAVVLRRLRRFQDAGHTAVLIVGDFTARVGDPSGKSETRPRLEKETVDAFAERLLDQFRLILSEERLEIRRNSEWLEPMTMEQVLGLTASYTVAQMLERDDFAKRFRDGRPISVMEFLYPLLQGYDSVAVEADVELGGTDQLFNLLVGRELQRDRGQDPQMALTMPLLEGTDGVQKMSQSLGNYIAITEAPAEMFGKLMRVPDGLISKYLRLCADAGADDVRATEQGLADGSLRPNDEKRRMARAVVELYHGAEAAATAEAHFDRVHRDRELPEEIQTVALSPGWASEQSGAYWVPRVLARLGLASSHNEGRRLIQQGAIRIDGEPLSDPEAELPADALRGRVLQVGRRQFVRLS
jgi:tyrosyl-tRNA synthetase